MHIHMNTTLGELFNNPNTKEAAKELTSRYLAAMNGGSDTASQSAAEAITEEIVPSNDRFHAASLSVQLWRILPG